MGGQIMTNKVYRNHEGVSRSELNILLTKSPLHLKYAQDHPDEDTPALLEGRAAHKLILEPDEFFDEFAVMPKCDRRTKEGKDIYAAFLDESEGKDVITDETLTKIQEMVSALRQNETANRFLQGEHEQSFFWTDTNTNEICKVRPDCLTEIDGRKYIVDYKTTESCADGQFERSIRKYGYKFQAGMYREGVFQNTFDDYGFVFVAQEKKPPYAVRVYVCNEDFISEGYEQFCQAISIYHWCKTHNIWYGYEGSENIITNLLGEGDI